MVNQLEHDFLALEPETHWVTDIAEIKTQRSELYPCITLDLYEQHIVRVNAL